MTKWTRSSAAHAHSAARSILNERLPVGYQRPVGVGQNVVAAKSLDALFMSAVSFGELSRGIILRAPGKRRTELELWLETDLSILFSGRILPVTKEIADRALENGFRRRHAECEGFRRPWRRDPQSVGNVKNPPRLYFPATLSKQPFSKAGRSDGGNRFDDRDQISANGDDTLEGRRR